jgi:hypothetical protein
MRYQDGVFIHQLFKLPEILNLFVFRLLEGPADKWCSVLVSNNIVAAKFDPELVDI